MSDHEVGVRFTADEAVVLFEFATRFTNDDALSIEHPAERAALWHLCALLERELVEPFKPNYNEILATARERLAQQAGVGEANE